MLNLENLESTLTWLPAPVLQILSYVVHRHMGLFFLQTIPRIHFPLHTASTAYVATHTSPPQRGPCNNP